MVETMGKVYSGFNFMERISLINETIFDLHSDDVDEVLETLKGQLGMKVISVNLYRHDKAILDQLHAAKAILSISDFIRQAIAEKLVREIECLKYYQDWKAMPPLAIPNMETNLREDFHQFYYQQIQTYDTFSFHQIVQNYLDAHHVPKMHRLKYYHLIRKMNVNIIGESIKMKVVQKTALGSKSCPIYQRVV